MQEASANTWKNRLNLPAYRVGEAASYARISPQTVATWEKTYDNRRAVLTSRDERQGLSFLQLIEVAVVAELRRSGLSLAKIRSARQYFVKVFEHDTPFATQDFKTDGTDILLEMKGKDGEVIADKLVVANSNGQLVWTSFLSDQFKEFRYADGIVVSWRVRGPDSEILIDPKLSFGAPSIRGVMTRAIKNEWASGAKLDAIADDYDLPITIIKEALIFEGIFFDEMTLH